MARKEGHQQKGKTMTTTLAATEYGTLEVTLVNASTARVETPNREPITIRSKAYSVSADFKLGPDGWEHVSKGAFLPTVQHWKFTNWNTAAAAPTIAAKAVEAARKALELVATSEALRAAEIERAERAVRAAIDEDEQARKAYEQARANLAAAREEARIAKGE